MGQTNSSIEINTELMDSLSSYDCHIRDSGVLAAASQFWFKKVYRSQKISKTITQIISSKICDSSTEATVDDMKSMTPSTAAKNVDYCNALSQLLDAVYCCDVGTIDDLCEAINDECQTSKLDYNQWILIWNEIITLLRKTFGKKFTLSIWFSLDATLLYLLSLLANNESQKCNPQLSLSLSPPPLPSLESQRPTLRLRREDSTSYEMDCNKENTFWDNESIERNLDCLLALLMPYQNDAKKCMQNAFGRKYLAHFTSDEPRCKIIVDFWTHYHSYVMAYDGCEMVAYGDAMIENYFRPNTVLVDAGIIPTPVAHLMCKSWDASAELCFWEFKSMYSLTMTYFENHFGDNFAERITAGLKARRVQKVKPFIPHN